MVVTMGAPLGNTNANKNKQWADTMRRALLENDGEKLRAAVESVIAAAIAGDVSAANHIAERIDGKVKQVVVHEGDDEAPLTIHLTPSEELRKKIRGIIHDGAERALDGGTEQDPTVFGTGQSSSGLGIRETQRPNGRLPTRQVVVSGDKLDAYRGSGDQPIEP